MTQFENRLQPPTRPQAVTLEGWFKQVVEIVRALNWTPEHISMTLLEAGTGDLERMYRARRAPIQAAKLLLRTMSDALRKKCPSCKMIVPLNRFITLVQNSNTERERVVDVCVACKNRTLARFVAGGRKVSMIRNGSEVSSAK